MKVSRIREFSNNFKFPPDNLFFSLFRFSLKRKIFFSRVRVIALTVSLITFYSISAYAYWIWTPETGKWINPKYAVKDSPQAQLEWAMSSYNTRDYNRAIKEFRRLIAHYPLSPLAAEAQYYIGLSREGLEKYYQAFLAYQKTIDTYPYTKRTEEIVEKQYRIGNIFSAGKKVKVLGVAISPVHDKAVEIFRAVINNAPYGKYVDVAQYKIGLYFKENNDLAQAKLEFEKLVKEYPQSSLVEKARYQIALCSLDASLDYNYDQSLTDKALKNFKRVLKESGRGDIDVEGIAPAISKLKDKKAKKTYKVAEFYERQGHIKSAKIYYHDVIDNFPGTLWAAKASERLRLIKDKE